MPGAARIRTHDGLMARWATDRSNAARRDTPVVHNRKVTARIVGAANARVHAAVQAAVAASGTFFSTD